MRRDDGGSGILRIGVFYDGTYFAHASNYYLYQHPRRARISISGLHEFLREEVAKHEHVDKRYCQIVDAHYFRGRMSAKQASEHDSSQLYKDRQWDDVLIREGVIMHLLPMASGVGGIKEKGIDVWFALEAFELAMYKRFDVSVLVTGDGDYVPLVRKLNTLGTRVMLLAWDFESEHGKAKKTTRAAQKLIDEVTYAVMMSDEIDARNRKGDPIIEGIFLPQAANDISVASVSEDGHAATGSEDTGQVINLVVDKGYGFIKPDRGGENVFFHARDLPEGIDFANLKDGDRFRYKLTRNQKGAPAAKNLIMDKAD